jgi:molecular chaperone IbpA
MKSNTSNLPATTTTANLSGVSGTTTYTYPNTSYEYRWMPSIHNWGIGFEKQWDLFDTLYMSTSKNAYPPYNIVRVTEDDYRIELAIAGFSKKDIEVIQQEQVLTVSGTKPNIIEDSTYVHKGIGARDFKHTFALADYVEVVSAKLEDGILTITLRRELPEDKKPRTITVK